MNAAHRTFSWLHGSLEGRADAEFLALTYDICRGASLVFDLTVKDNISQASEAQALLDAHELEALQLFATRSLGMLADTAFSRLDEMNDKAIADTVTKARAGGAA